jgi:chaperonin cofactor prefoldin
MVNDVIDNLREALEDMEEVLETLEYAERQKTADEQEIETLRRTLKQIHRPREGGGSQQNPPPQYRGR